jgi:hypothetical protein
MHPLSVIPISGLEQVGKCLIRYTIRHPLGHFHQILRRALLAAFLSSKHESVCELSRAILKGKIKRSSFILPSPLAIIAS